MLPKSIGAIIAIISLILFLRSTIQPDSFSAIAQNDDPTVGLWYVGEGLTRNMQLMYRLQYFDTNNGRPFDVTILFKEQNEARDWLTNFQIVLDNGTKLETDVLLKESDLSPTKILDNLSSTKTYIDAYSHTLQFLGAFGTRDFPVSLRVSSWGGLACEGCPKIQLRSPEKITIGAGIFNTTLIYYGQRLDIWVLDDFPYPLKGLLYTGSANSTLVYSYELLEATVNGIPIPEFEQAFLLIISALTLTVVMMRLYNGSKRS